MKIEKMELINFRNFKERRFEFNDHVNVLIGDNGAGKTAVLAAITGAIVPLLEVFGGEQLVLYDEEALGFNKTDVRRISHVKKGAIASSAPPSPTTVACSGVLNSEAIRWTIGNARISKLSLLDTQARLMLKAVSLEPEAVCLPLLAHYGIQRLFNQEFHDDPLHGLAPRLHGYGHWFNPGSVVQGLKSLARRASTKRAALKGVEEAIAACLSGWDDSARYDASRDRIVRSSDGRVFAAGGLSGGPLNMLSMARDMAYRAAVLNPQFGAEAAQKTPGIVLIDEIDLNLHPKWQRRVIDDIRRAFPLVQFFATTHSPFIIQSLRPGELIILDDAPGGEYYARSIEDIVEDVMGVPEPQRSERWHKMRGAAEQYYRVLRQTKGVSPDKLAQLKARLDILSEPFGDNPAYVAFLNMKRAAAGLGEDM